MAMSMLFLFKILTKLASGVRLGYYIASTEQSGYQDVRSFPRQNNLDISFRDHFLDRTIWISDVTKKTST